MSDKAFVELKFSEAVISIFDNFIKETIPENMLYYSPVAEHIRGNMSKTLHCTVLFGLTEDSRKNESLKNLIDRNKVEKIYLGKLSYIAGYENLYKVLVIEILDNDGKLNKLHKALESFALKEDPDFKVREFKPHLTLAYVQNEFELPSNLPELAEFIEVEKLEVSLVSEFNRSVNSQKNPSSRISDKNGYYLKEVDITSISDLIQESISDFIPTSTSKGDILDFIKSASQEENFYLFALKDRNGNLAGYITNVKYKNDLYTAAIGPMFISQKFRGRGLGKLQVELFLNFVKSKGFKKVITKTWGNNKGSRKIFGELGFLVEKIDQNDRIDGDSTIKYVLEL